MRKLILATITGLMLVPAALAGPTAAGSTQLIVAMRDPGCHWFYSGGGPNHRKYTKTAVRHGAVTLLNLDEAALKIKGPGGTKQAADDNHLRLTIK